MTRIQEKRYEFARKKLHLKKEKEPKFIIIQIDALPYRILQKAREKGYAKFLDKLISEGYNLEKYNCGIPSGTPAIHSAIMYGHNEHIVGYRFMDKKSKKYYTFGKPGSARELQKKLYGDDKGILAGGSSYGNHFSGGAKRTVFTMSTISKSKRLQRLKDSDIWLLVLFNPWSLARVLYYSVLEVLIELSSVVISILTSWFTKKKGIYSVWLPFRRLLLNAVMTELITKGILIDIQRNVSKIYATYLTYDDMAHFRGPESREAYFAIRATDRRVKRIYKQAKKKGYDVYIMSDHGQIPCVPFKSLNGQDLAEYIQELTKKKAYAALHGEKRDSLMRVALMKTASAAHYLSGPLRWIYKSIVKTAMAGLVPQKYYFDWNNKEAVFVVDSCSLAHVYFNSKITRSKKEELQKKYPGMLKELIKHKGIGLVMLTSNKGEILIGKEGIVKLEGKLTQKGKKILKRFGKPARLFAQFKQFKIKKNLGDLVLFGNITKGVGVSFTDHVGAHGGIGVDMMEPFFISKEKVDLSKTIDAKDLHEIFKKYN